MDEYLDLVDEENRPTGKTELRSVVHSTGLWHRTVHVYLFRRVHNNIEFLVHLRSKNKDTHPDCWDTRFGGHPKAGEDIETGVIKEVKEEIGLDVNPSELMVGQWRKRDKYPACEFTKVFYLEYNAPLEHLSFNDGEVQEVRWLSVKDIINSMDQEPGKWSGGRNGFEEISNFLTQKWKN